MSVVKKIILINLFVFGLCIIPNIFGIHLENLFALYPIDSGLFSFYQLLTHIFVHANVEHLFFNMLFLLLAGEEVEKYYGNKFLTFYILSGILSSGLYCLAAPAPIIGASGAVFSVIATNIFVNIKNKNFKNLWSYKFRIAFFTFLIFSELFYSLTVNNDNIGHLAHIFGVIFASIYFFSKNFDRP